MQVARQRRIVWWNFTADTWERSSTRAQRLAIALHELLSSDVSLDEDRNAWELRVWDDLLADRKAQHGERAH